MKDPQLNAMAVPSMMDLVMYCSTCLFGLNGVSYIIFSCGGLDVLFSPVPKHLTVMLLPIYVLLFSELVWGEGI